MEAHHCVIEWAFTNLVDLAKFQKAIVAPRAKTDPDKYGRKFTKAEMRGADASLEQGGSRRKLARGTEPPPSVPELDAGAA